MNEKQRETSKIEDRLDAIRQGFLSKLGHRLDEIADLWQEARANVPDLEPLRRLQRKVHSLNGAAATFGLRSMSEVAENIESILDLTVKDAGMLNPELESRISDGLRALRSVSLSTRRRSQDFHPARARRTTTQEGRDAKLVYLLDDDAFYEGVARQLTNFGFEVHRFSLTAALCDAALKRPPDAFVIDDGTSSGGLDAARTVKALFEDPGPGLPVMLVSAKRDLPARLEAVRAGVNAYVTKPIELGAVLDRLEDLLSEDDPDPGRVLIVEDDPCLAQHNAALLEQAGLVTRIVTDPLKVLPPLADWNPDLILMDLDMPGCTGLELATLIRQDEAYVSIPIVFLSGETCVDVQHQAISRGGDDFLAKSIEPDHFISTIVSRIQRVRALRSLIFKDALTGLFNHGAIMEQLDLEVQRALRTETPLSFTIIDLDRFKSVNDTHGHATGSRVIKSAARLLQQRTRKMDAIGRYGGEEFCVIMPGATESVARERIEELRRAWSEVTHQGLDGEFHVTFSAGTVECDSGMTAHDLLEAADRALYAAKSSGRNQVAVASELRLVAEVEA